MTSPIPKAARVSTFGLRPDAKIRACLPTGLASLDALVGGFPRGAISEILGPEHSGRTTLAHALLAASTAQFEICPYVDTDDSFDPGSVAAAGVALAKGKVKVTKSFFKPLPSDLLDALEGQPTSPERIAAVWR